MELIISNYLHSNKWFSVINYTLERFPEEFPDAQKVSALTSEEELEAISIRVKDFLLARARTNLRANIGSSLVKSYAVLPEDTSMRNFISKELDSFEGCMEQMISTSLAGKTQTFARKNAIFFLFSLLPEWDEKAPLHGDDAVDTADAIMNGIRENELSPRDLNEFIILAGLWIGLTYPEIRAFQLHYAHIETPMIPADFTDNMTAGMWDHITSMRKYPDLIRCLSDPELQSHFAQTRNTPYMVLFGNFNGGLVHADTGEPVDWTEIHLDSLIDISTLEEHNPSVAAYFRHIMRFACPEKLVIDMKNHNDNEISRIFRNLYHRYHDTEHYQKDYPGLNSIFCSGNYEKAGNRWLSQNEKHLFDHMKRFIYESFSDRFISNYYRAFLQPVSEHLPKVPAEERFTLAEMEELSTFFPGAFIPMDYFKEMLSRSYDITPPPGLLLLQILKAVIPSDAADDYQPEPEDENRTDYANYLLETTLCLDLSDPEDVQSSVNGLMSAAGYSHINRNDNFQRFTADLYTEVQKEHPGEASSVLLDIFFREFRKALRLILTFLQSDKQEK